MKNAKAILDAANRCEIAGVDPVDILDAAAVAPSYDILPALIIGGAIHLQRATLACFHPKKDSKPTKRTKIRGRVVSRPMNEQIDPLRASQEVRLKIKRALSPEAFDARAAETLSRTFSDVVAACGPRAMESPLFRCCVNHYAEVVNSTQMSEANRNKARKQLLRLLRGMVLQGGRPEYSPMETHNFINTVRSMIPWVAIGSEMRNEPSSVERVAEQAREASLFGAHYADPHIRLEESRRIAGLACTVIERWCRTSESKRAHTQIVSMAADWAVKEWQSRGKQIPCMASGDTPLEVYRKAKRKYTSFAKQYEKESGNPMHNGRKAKPSAKDRSA